MEALAILKKATTPSILIGASLLIAIGAYIASSKSMSLTLTSVEGAPKTDVSKPARVCIGMVIITCGLIIAYKTIYKTSE